MNDSANTNVQLVDQLASTAHEFINRLQARATEMEVEFGKQSQQSGDQFLAGVDAGMVNLQKMIRENPMMAAAIAFGIGVFATRVLNTDSSGEAEEEDVAVSEAA